MELIEIIINVLKIFSLASIAILILSYFFFKVKDRTRIKPYMLVDTESALLVDSAPAAYEMQVNVNSEDPLRYKQLSNRFHVINEERPAVQSYSNHSSFYKPMVRENSINIAYETPYMNSNQQGYAVGEISNNIYNYYSPGSEQMHRLKIGR